MWIYLVFHISLLEPAPHKVRTTVVQLNKDIQDDVYKVEKVLDKQDIGGKPHYLIKWSGYNTLENT